MDEQRTLHTKSQSAVALLAALLTSLAAPNAFASIIGGEGNKPIGDPGWPRRAAVFNTPSRIAWWEGPPFGGGQWRSECRGDARALRSMCPQDGFASSPRLTASCPASSTMRSSPSSPSGDTSIVACPNRHTVVSGRVTDDAGQPGPRGRRSPAPGRCTRRRRRDQSRGGYSVETDAQGRFRADRVPAGTASVWLHKSGYCRPGLGQPINIRTQTTSSTRCRNPRESS